MMADWKAWLGSLGDTLVDAGNPAGFSKTVTASSVDDDGGTNPLSGYTIVSAETMDEAISIAKKCPHGEHGSIEVAQLMAMPV